MTDLSIRVEDLGKQFHIGGTRSAHRTLRDSLAGAVTAPFRRMRSVLAGRASTAASETMWALRNVSFEVRAGEIVGIIGANGAGKSTLLKILSRITEPTEGRAMTRGRLGSLLEVGTGFHSELTGRENVFLNGAILGLRRAEILRKFDEIVDFAGIERFMDTPVKHYSSGMYVRLAFAVAAHLEPDVLMVDEVLSVGDAAFQRKCLGKMDEVASGGRTVLFVSHNMGTIQRLCGRVIWLTQGTVAEDGTAREVISRYLLGVNTTDLDLTKPGDERGLVVERVVLRRADGTPATTFEYGDDIAVEIRYRTDLPVRKPFVWIDVTTTGGIFGANMLFDDLRPDVLEGRGTITCTFRGVRLLPRPEPFLVHLGILDDRRRYIVHPAQVSAFLIGTSTADVGLLGEHSDEYTSLLGPMVVPYEWQLPNGDVVAPDWAK